MLALVFKRVKRNGLAVFIQATSRTAALATTLRRRASGGVRLCRQPADPSPDDSGEGSLGKSYGCQPSYQNSGRASWSASPVSVGR